MTDTASRLLKRLSILQSGRAWTGSELAGRLEISARTVRRDIERLRDLGYPVQATMGLIGGYRLVAGTAMPPLLLEDDEAVAIAVGLRTAAVHAVEGLEEVSLRALASSSRCSRSGSAAGSARWARPPCRCSATSPPPSTPNA